MPITWLISMIDRITDWHMWRINKEYEVKYFYFFLNYSFYLSLMK